jgi:hypothetical protein
MSDILEEFRQITLALTVTSGRSGTKLLAVLMSNALRLAAMHEPAPRVNFVLRAFIEAPSAARAWLITEKLPAMFAASRNGFYAETSHLFCKGLIEPILSLGIHPKLIILTRPAREVASSLYQMNSIPVRTESGRLVLLGPNDPGVTQLSDWHLCSDYQLCYWYAREIERRQSHYAALCSTIGMESIRIAMHDLLAPGTLQALANFFGAVANDEAFARQETITKTNQNSRRDASGYIEDRRLPLDLDAEEAVVDGNLAYCTTRDG